MSYDDVYQAEADWRANTDATTLFEMGLLPDPGEYCECCEMTRTVTDEPIDDSTNIMRTCDECEHEWRVKKEDQ